jgi:hypothetical protein
MPVAARYTRILIDEFNFSGVSNQASVELTLAALDASNFETAAMAYVPGLPSGQINHGGYYNGPAAGDLERELEARLGGAGDAYVAVLFGTNTAGCPCYVGPATWGQQLTITMPFDGLITLAGQWPMQTLQRGLRAGSGTVTSTGALDSVDFGAAGAAGGQAFLFVQAVDGAGVVVEIEDSADDETFALLDDFTVNAVGVTALALPTTIDQYIRINVTDMGAATTITFTAVVCVNGVTQ